MRKIKENIEYEETIKVCSKCWGTITEKEGDWDSYGECDDCGLENYTGELETIKVLKQQLTRLIEL